MTKWRETKNILTSNEKQTIRLNLQNFARVISKLSPEFVSKTLKKYSNRMLVDWHAADLEVVHVQDPRETLDPVVRRLAVHAALQGRDLEAFYRKKVRKNCHNEFLLR